MNAASRGVGAFFRAARLSLALGAALGVSACISPDMSEIGDPGAMLSPFASNAVAQKPRPVEHLHRLDPQGRERRGRAGAGL